MSRNKIVDKFEKTSPRLRALHHYSDDLIERCEPLEQFPWMVATIRPIFPNGAQHSEDFLEGCAQFGGFALKNCRMVRVQLEWRCACTRGKTFSHFRKFYFGKIKKRPAILHQATKTYYIHFFSSPCHFKAECRILSSCVVKGPDSGLPIHFILHLRTILLQVEW